MALGPGTTWMSTPAFRASRTKWAPGSETSGIPASDTRAIDAPACSLAMRLADFPRSLCSWRLVVGVAIE